MKHLIYLVLFSSILWFTQESFAQAKGYQIEGAVTGYADGTPVAFLNDEAASRSK